MNQKRGVLLILVCLFIPGCIGRPPQANVAAGTKPAEMALEYQILDVPLFAQATRMWCWAASGEMIMHYYEEEVPQHVQANNRFKRGDCGLETRSPGCIKGGWPQFELYGFNSPESRYGALSWQELVAQIQAYQPVGFSWEWKPCEGRRSSGSHYMVARGYIILNNTRLVVVNDPLPMNGDKTKGGTVSIMTYDDYVQFCPRYLHSYTQYDITKPGVKRFLSQKCLSKVQGPHAGEGLSVKNPQGKNNKTLLRGVQGGGFLEKSPPGRRALEALELLKALPWPILKELGFETKAMVGKSRLGKQPFYTLGMGAGRWQDSEEIPGDVLEVHYPVEVDNELVTSITLRKRRGEWEFAVIGDSRALSAVKALREIPVPREPPSYFLVQFQSLNLSFLAYFLEEEEEDYLLYLIPTQEDPDLKFPLYEPVPAAEVFLELKVLLEQLAEAEGEAVQENQLTGYWRELDKALDDLDCREKTRVLSGVKRLLEIIDNIIGIISS